MRKIVILYKYLKKLFEFYLYYLHYSKMAETKKRETAYKFRIGDLLHAKQIFDNPVASEGGQVVNQRLLHVELGAQKIVRVNLIANVVDKYQSEGESRFASITIDDGSGQIKTRVFGEEIKKFTDIVQGDTVLIIGLLRSFNQEMYLLPEIIRKQDPKYLLVRKLEIDALQPRIISQGEKKELRALRDQIIDLIKTAEKYDGIDKDTIVMQFKQAKPDLVSREIITLLEEGIIYEPRPGRVRYLG